MWHSARADNFKRNNAGEQTAVVNASPKIRETAAA